MRNSVIKKNRKIYIFKHQQTSSGGGADLENNKTATIDVSAYTEPVEITPTEGKDGMKKATVTLSNIPSPSGSVTLYAWVKKTSHEVIFTNFNIAPQSIPSDDTEHKCIVSIENIMNEFTMRQYIGNGYSYGKTNDNEFYIEDTDTTETEQEFVRDSTKDIEVWG